MAPRWEMEALGKASLQEMFAIPLSSLLLIEALPYLPFAHVYLLPV